MLPQEGQQARLRSIQMSPALRALVKFEIADSAFGMVRLQKALCRQIGDRRIVLMNARDEHSLWTGTRGGG